MRALLAERRVGVIKSHLDLLKPGGLAIINVPNRFSPIYRGWMGAPKRRGTWPLGTEVPFSVKELRTLAERAGGVPLKAQRGSGLGTLVNQGPNNVLRKLGLPVMPVPQWSIPGIDVLAYDLMSPWYGRRSAASVRRPRAGRGTRARPCSAMIASSSSSPSPGRRRPDKSSARAIPPGRGRRKGSAQSRCGRARPQRRPGQR